MKVSTPFTDLDETELALVAIGADMEQLAWRRWKLKELIPPRGYTARIAFKQWYPSTPDEAFIFSGNKVFPQEYLEGAALQVAEPLATGKFNVSDGEFHETKEGYEVEIWAYPKDGQEYCIGIDVAEGLEHGDFSSIDVLTWPQGVQVLQANLHIHPD